MPRFSSIRIILVGTTHPGNIGASARAMKTMGLTRLYLVKPKFFPHENATAMAAGAEDLLAACQVVNSLDQALEGCQLVIASSARSRQLELPCLSPKTLAQLVIQQSDETEIAIVFGPERSGLSNQELLLSHYRLMIPANPDYSSLNLSQAVQIISYELRSALIDASPIKAETQLASMKEIDLLYQHMGQVMQEVGFFNPANPKRLQDRLRRLINRSHLELMEVNILRGFLAHIQKHIQG